MKDKLTNGFNEEYTYDKNGNELTYKSSNGFYTKKTYNENGKLLTYKDSMGNKIAYDGNGNELTYIVKGEMINDYRPKEMNIEQIEKELGYKVKLVE